VPWTGPLLTLYVAVQSSLPSWLETPGWFRHLERGFFHAFFDHQAAGLFAVIFLEELGVPLPAPGDVAIALGGYMTTTGRIPLFEAYVAVVVGAMLGSSVNYYLARRYGHPFLVRFGPYVGLSHERLDHAEAHFRRWGAWAIIVGRHVPGMRIVISAFAGAFEVPYRIFLPSVAVSATIWAAIFISLGRYLGPRTRLLFRLVPAHLVPWLLLVLAIGVIAFLAYEHGYRPRKKRRGAAPAVPPGEQEPATR
jgi:membrane-associated protein